MAFLGSMMRRRGGRNVLASSCLVALSLLAACDRKPDPSPPPMALPTRAPARPAPQHAAPAPKTPRATADDRRAVLDNMMANANVRADAAAAYAAANGLAVDPAAMAAKRRTEAARASGGRPVGGAEYMGDPSMDGPPGAPEPAGLRRTR